MAIGRSDPATARRFSTEYSIGRPQEGVACEQKCHDAESMRNVPEHATSPHGKVTLLAVRVVPCQRRLPEVSAAAGHAVRRLPTQGRGKRIPAKRPTRTAYLTGTVHVSVSHFPFIHACVEMSLLIIL